MSGSGPAPARLPPGPPMADRHPSRLLAAAGRVLLVAAAAAAGGALGLSYGDRLGYALAALVDRDPAELKDTLIWGIIGSSATLAAAGAWLALWVSGAGVRWRRGALVVVAVVALVSAGLMAAAYDWPKSEGVPVIEYQLRLPSGYALPDDTGGIAPIGLSIWSAGSGKGAYIRSFDDIEGHLVVSGSFLLGKDDNEPMMSIRFLDGPLGYWRVPYAPDAALEPDFGPWLPIEFVAPLGKELLPLDGAYEIRYRVRRYM